MTLIVEIDRLGTFVGGEACNHPRKVAEQKPVALRRPTWRPSGPMGIRPQLKVTGSIGVIMQTADIAVMLEKLGIKRRLRVAL